MKTQEWLFKKLPVGQQQIIDVEKKLGKYLPASIRCFLYDNNGASPRNNIFYTKNGKELIFESVVDIIAQVGGDSFLGCIENLKGQLPSGIFPIGFDPFGNVFYCDIGVDSTPVFFWQHDNDDEDIKISESFDSFLKNLSGE